MNESVSLVPSRPEARHLAIPCNNPETISEYLEQAAETCNLVSPATRVGELPEGCSVVISRVSVRADPAVGDVYLVQGGGGRLGLSKSVLERLASAAGVSWLPERSGRMDDGGDPRYCLFRMVGRYYHFDGREQIIQGIKEIDLREGSAQLELLRAGARSSDRAGQQILMLRSNLVGHAETKARLRAIRSMGIKSGYFPRELEKPFVVARLSFTGQTPDPALRREFSIMRLRGLMGQSVVIGELNDNSGAPGHGGPFAAANSLEPGPPSHAVGSVGWRRAESAQVEPRGMEPARPAPSAGLVLPEETTPCIRFGPAKGTPVLDADDSTLRWYGGVIEGYLAQPGNVSFRGYNEHVLRVLREEQARRQRASAS